MDAVGLRRVGRMRERVDVNGIRVRPAIVGSGQDFGRIRPLILVEVRVEVRFVESS